MSSYSGFMSCTEVTPRDAACLSARRAALIRCSWLKGGTTLLMMGIAASLNRPVGSPRASRTITPPGGSAVAAVTPASRMAAELASAMWPS